MTGGAAPPMFLLPVFAVQEPFCVFARAHRMHIYYIHLFIVNILREPPEESIDDKF